MTSPLRKRAENAPSSDQRLLDCLCSAPDPVSKVQLAELAELDWNRVVASATKHGVRPLLYERLASVASTAGIPDTVLTLLRESFLVNGLRNVLLYQDLGDVLEGFQQQGITSPPSRNLPIRGLRFIGPSFTCVTQAKLPVIGNEHDQPSLLESKHWCCLRRTWLSIFACTPGFIALARGSGRCGTFPRPSDTTRRR